jgi:hypothetical protein
MALTISNKDNRHPDNKNSNESQAGRANQIEPDCWVLLVTTRSLNKYPTQKTKNEDVNIK